MKNTKAPLLRPEQCRMARAALRWGVQELAEEADLAENTITAFELSRSVRESSIFRIKAAFERHGIKFAQAPEAVTVEIV